MANLPLSGFLGADARSGSTTSAFLTFKKDLPMEPSSKMCLAQVAAQRDRAATTNLPSVKALAERAAGVWSAQADAARARETREVARANRAKFAQAVAMSDHDGI